jgi:protein-S-isoprenylcysteine O-methyltransferase Ste14
VDDLTIAVTKLVIFLTATIGFAWVSRISLRNPQSHGFYRFFAWEGILFLFLMNVNYWFSDPRSPIHLLSWLLLILSLVFIIEGVRLFRTQGKIKPDRNDPELVSVEKTTELVTTGLYGYIRHPFYSSLLFLAWGILLKHVTWYGTLLALIVTLLLVITAKKEEAENIGFFGEPYQEYMKRTKMFVPFLL